MSIATLKRKTQAKYNNSSVGQKQFSLNGTHRNQGYVGQTMLSRHFPSTLMKGNVARGHGGCCGKYTITPIVQSGVNYQEDSTVVKSSVINTLGMIINKYDCIGSCILGQENDQGCSKRVNVVKPDNNHDNNTQQMYITNLAKKAIKDTTTCNEIYKDVVPVRSICDPVLGVITSVTSQCLTTKSDEQTKIPITYDKYLLQLDNLCISNNVKSKNSISYRPLPSN